MNSRTLLSSVAALTLAGLVVTGCAAPSGGGGGGSQSPQQTSQEGLPPTVPIDASQARRLQEIMKPLIANMNQPLPANQVRVQVWDDPQINAANAGGGEFYITTGLLNRGTDNQIVFTTTRYREHPLIITGPGAGPAVTAAGVLNDILQLTPS